MKRKFIVLFVLFLFSFFTKLAFSQSDSSHISGDAGLDSSHISDNNSLYSKDGVYIKGLGNINNLFSRESESYILNLKKIPNQYSQYIRTEMLNYNGELDSVITKLNKNQKVNNINDVFTKYKELRKFSNLLFNYNNIATTIEMNYMLINTTILYAQKEGIDPSVINTMNYKKSQLDSILSDIESSLYKLLSLDFNSLKSVNLISNSMKEDYFEIKNNYQHLSDDILSTVESILLEQGQ